ncbi:sensor histidine kinase [Rhizorhabdus histidinilytica]|uniref:histidine kinase n=2 Tax=Rhizorhabdus histidinilytica TaxID=439228 RepID=A0A1T5D368_9SPHN|nr:CHASE3 domain-containing protein [Rhizorhabdus histidinilytica]SKB65950.1 PAS fold [Rhizorhabdus histidinilytica]
MRQARTPAAIKRLVMGASISFVILGLLLMITVRETLSSAAASRQAVAASHDRISRLDALMAALLEAEVGQRGYVITGDESFLEPYRKALDQFRSAIVILAHIDPKRADALTTLIREKLAFIADTVILRRERGFEAAASTIRSGRGKQLMDDIRVQLAGLEEEEHRELARRETLRAANERIERLTIYGALAGALTVVGIAGFLLRRELHFRGLAELKARRQTDYLRATLENLDHGVALLDSEGRVVEKNAKLESFLTPSPGAAADAGLDPQIVAAARAGAPLFKVVDHDDGRFMEVRGSQAPNGSYVVTFTDISARRRAENMKAAFVSNVSHELRTPLTSIRASLRLMVGPLKADLTDRVARLATIADRNAENLLKLVSDLLDLDKIESGKMTFDFAVVDLNTIVAEAAEMNRAYAEARGVGIAVGLPASAVQVKADAPRIQQVMANLVSNAAKFSPEGGIVVISVEKGNETARIVVHDSGPGIPEHFRSEIFEKFSQARSSDSTKLGGSGLGLNIAKAIVEGHGGELSFDSRPGDTNFWFTLPLSTPDRSNAEQLAEV